VAQPCPTRAPSPPGGRRWPLTSVRGRMRGIAAAPDGSRHGDRTAPSAGPTPRGWAFRSYSAPAPLRASAVRDEFGMEEFCGKPNARRRLPEPLLPNIRAGCLPAALRSASLMRSPAALEPALEVGSGCHNLAHPLWSAPGRKGHADADLP